MHIIGEILTKKKGLREMRESDAGHDPVPDPQQGRTHLLEASLDRCITFPYR
jgi:hypothetical protein